MATEDVKGVPLFDRDMIVDLQSHTLPSFRVWQLPLPGHSYTLATDPCSGMANGDPAAIEIIDTATGEQCAEYAAVIDPIALATLIFKWATLYNHALVAIEVNTGPGAVTEQILRTGMNYQNMYHSQGYSGWHTTTKVRNHMIIVLQKFLADHPTLIHSYELLHELDYKNTNNAEDNRAMAMMIALAIAWDVTT